jgi:glycosyltransferase involved in cell wall biosynthesis
MPEPLRVVVLSALSADSGSYLRACRLGRALERAGARVTVVKSIRSMPFMLHYPISLLLYLRVLVRRCDVVIGLKPLPNVGIVLLVKKLLGSLTVVDIDDIDFGFRTGWLARLNRLLQLPTPKRCDLVTYHTDRLRPFIRETFGVADDRLYQLPQGVDLDLCTPPALASTNSLRTALGLRGTERLVVYAAHLNIASDLDAIFDIIRIASRRRPDLRLLVVGGGPLEQHFRRMARDLGVDKLTIFTGYVSPERVGGYLALGDAALVYYKDIDVNYFRESMKLRDMLALGLKVVCNDVGDLKRFEDYTYQTGTAHEEVARQLVRLIESGGDGREARGMAYVRRLDWNDIGAGLLSRLVEARQASTTSRARPQAAGGLR